MLTKIKCPKCSADNTFSLSDPSMKGPISAANVMSFSKSGWNIMSLVSCEPIDPNEEAKLEEIRAMKDKFRHGGA